MRDEILRQQHLLRKKYGSRFEVLMSEKEKDIINDLKD